MARINLLPWRAERRKQRPKEFGVMLAFAALAGLALWFLVNSYSNGQIAGQAERNASMPPQIRKVHTKSKTIAANDRQNTRLPATTECTEQTTTTEKEKRQ